jgi:hypothetical protein
VKTHMNAGMFSECLDKRQVATRIGLLQHVIEVAARLMRVNQQN